MRALWSCRRSAAPHRNRSLCGHSGTTSSGVWSAPASATDGVSLTASPTAPAVAGPRA